MLEQTTDQNILTARACAAKGDIIRAIHGYYHAIESAPGNASYKNEFIHYIRPMNLRVESKTLKTVMTACLADPNAHWRYAGSAWYSFLISDPSFGPAKKLIRTTSYQAFKRRIADPAAGALLNDSYFLYGIGRTVVPNWDFERFLTYLRRYLLEHPSARARMPGLPYVLARYCHRTAYIFHVSDSEKKQLAALGNIETERAMAACYRPISPGEAHTQGASEAWKQLASEQSSLLISLQTQRAGIKALTPVREEVSKAVQQQYEQYPYPLWDDIAPGIVDQKEAEAIQKGAGNILVAGCGTGREAIELAATYPQAKVLAVDLSLSSLAYAKDKAKKFGISNIEFYQADILELGALDRTFDFIASSGVLHHMKDPLTGWKILESLLSSGGLMRISLYSERARWAINKARAKILSKGYAADDEGIRRFRIDARKQIGGRAWKEISNFFDYYFLNECRDMLFHVQETQYTIPMLMEQLSETNLRFEGFYLNPKILSLYKKKFPEDEQGRYLTNWDKFERKYPDIFREMYRFWCTKA